MIDNNIIQMVNEPYTQYNLIAAEFCNIEADYSSSSCIDYLSFIDFDLTDKKVYLIDRFRY